MVLVRTVFQVRQGHIGELVEMMKQATQAEPNRPRILTDLSGPINTMINDGRDFTPLSEVMAIGQACSADACGPLGDTLRAILATTNAKRASTIVVEAIDGDYARLLINTNDGQRDPIWAFVKREQSAWKIISSGSFFTPDDLQQLGVPKSLWLE
jgi:hypothetical protein